MEQTWSPGTDSHIYENLGDAKGQLRMMMQSINDAGATKMKTKETGYLPNNMHINSILNDGVFLNMKGKTIILNI